MIGSPTPAQLQNVVVVNRLSEARQGLEQMAAQQAAAIGQERVEVLLAAAREVDAQMVAACEPLLSSVSDSVEAILLTMHKEDFSGEVGAVTSPAPPCSLYMRELQVCKILIGPYATNCCISGLYGKNCQGFSVHLHLHPVPCHTVATIGRENHSQVLTSGNHHIHCLCFQVCPARQFSATSWLRRCYETCLRLRSA